ncbi:bestrophin family protein [Hymenobacter arizonensis]|uniref:Putative membrane protein n=1 Tax=Hymenobacter arizonensis TaxID=1227077 RepID=A0A1I6BL09_HYMAR|nr:bestrophin family ion channel [Hymenobacter arizonensis]SFQ81613.1 putative membrane protein [Hymenobacter arizonensis]
MLLDAKLPARFILRQILPDVAVLLLISVVFEGLKVFLGQYLPPIPLTLPAILGSAISLLLAFALSQSYDRWWEARKVWGAIVNDSRSLVLQGRSFVKPTHRSPALLRGLAYRQVAWCYGLGEALRGQDPMVTLARYLPPEERAYAERHANKPLALLALHTAQIQDLYEQGALNPYQQVQLDATLVRLCDAMGRAERIKSTVFPTNYRRLVHFLIYLFLGTLSLSLVEINGLVELPILLMFAVTFFLVERTARYMQDPFSNLPTDTPVTAIARTVEINLRHLLDEETVPAPLPAEAFYLM